MLFQKKKIGEKERGIPDLVEKQKERSRSAPEIIDGSCSF